jgi:ADP-ribosylglycohydrolase
MAVTMQQEQALGMIYGLALGDALGAPVEFWSFKRILEHYGPGGIQDLPEPARYTDDTQMTLAIAEALVTDGGRDLGAIMAAVSREFVSWLHSPENNRSPGGSCLYGARQLEAGVPWWQSGKPNSKGCGAVMRVAPIGYLYQGDPAKLCQVAAATGRATHHHPVAEVSAAAGAYLVKLILDGLPPEQLPQAMGREFRGQAQDFDQALNRLGAALVMDDDEAALGHIGEGWVAEEALMAALYCFLQSPGDFLATIRRGANAPGDSDSDSIASIAGGLSGVYLGIAALPPEWVAHIEKSPYLGDVSRRLAAAKDGLRRQSTAGTDG